MANMGMKRGIGASKMVMLIIVAACLVWGASAGSISVYWGRNGSEATLKQTCTSGSFGFVMLSFLTNTSGTPVLDLSGHCNATSGGCKNLSSEIQHCQDINVKVFLSMRGGYSFASPQDARLFADSLFNQYFGGTLADRPLGEAVLDGLDFDIQATTEHLDQLARSVYELIYYGKGKVYLSAAPQCAYPDEYLGAALQTGLFDYVWIKFYDNDQCEYDSDANNLVQAWNNWTSSVLTTQSHSFFLGLPASPDAASSGFIPAETLISSVLPQINSTSKYGGVMLWNKYYDERTYYSTSIKPSVYVCVFPWNIYENERTGYISSVV